MVNNKHIGFEDLDTLNGARLHQIRQNLAKQGKARAPRRRDGEQPQRRFEVAATKFSFKKKLGLSLVLGVTLGVGAGMLFGLSLVAAIAISGIVGLGFYEAKTLQQNHLKKSKQALSKNPRQWLAEHEAGYRVGYESKAWAPYLKSFLDKQAYMDYPAYQVGLEEAVANRALRIKI